jgi:hypothetical protein
MSTGFVMVHIMKYSIVFYLGFEFKVGMEGSQKPREIDTPEMITLHKIIKDFVFWIKRLKEKTESVNKTENAGRIFWSKDQFKKKNCNTNLFTSLGI